MMTSLTDLIAQLSPQRRALLLARLQQKRRATGAAPEIVRRQIRDSFSLSFAQQRLWFLDQLEGDSAIYNISAVLRLSGVLDVPALKRSLDEIVRRHEILRSRIEITRDQPRQRVKTDQHAPFSVIDLTELPESERSQRAERLAQEEARRPFDLSRGPCLRTQLLRLGVSQHWLLFTIHHIVADGWSLGVLTQELMALYKAFSSGLPSPLPELPFQYADYAEWQRDWLLGAGQDIQEDEATDGRTALSSQLAYWRERLAGATPVLTLPTDRPRPPFQTYNGATLHFQLPELLHVQLNALSRQEGTTLFMTMLAAFNTLLYRYTGQTDICLGTPVANRNRLELEQLIGFFVNTLVIRTDLAEQPSFRDLLARVRQVVLEAYAHQDLPFEVLVDSMRSKRDTSHSPLFQVMFDLKNAPRWRFRLPGLSVDTIPLDTETAKFDLNLSLEENPSSLEGWLTYNTDLFDKSTMERMVGQFETLLEGIIADPNRSISTLPLLNPTERQLMLQEWNSGETDFPQEQTIHQRFEQRAEQMPDATAVSCQGSSLSFAAVNRQANQLARHLRRMGVGPDVPVGIALRRSVQTVVGILGILKAGGAYLPLDPTYPAERISFMVQDSGIPLLITQADLADRFVDSGARILCLDKDWPAIAQEREANLPSRALPEHVAYVIYTSGSTGKPKGVMITHHSALHLAAALNQAIYQHRDDRPLRISLNAPLPFDASVQQLVMLTYGHTLVIIPEDARSDAHLLLDTIRQHRIDVLDCVPTQLKLLVDAGLLEASTAGANNTSGQAGPWTPGVILPGGEAIDSDTWNRLVRASHIDFFNMYGPTECTVDASTANVSLVPDRPTIGRPLGSARLYVLDQHLQPCPIGVPGELYIGGPGLARGYLNRPALTAERFLPDPFSGDEGARLYRTGDLVRYLPDGNLDFLGRADHQVKVRGFRIELGEIEAVLAGHPDVDQAVVLARKDSPGESRLVAYLVPLDGATPTASGLRRHLQESLPDYMVPSAFVILEALPLTPNRKVDRRALPAPDHDRPDLDGAYVPPRSLLETFLVRKWEEILGLNGIGVTDDFFELGGNSLQAAVLINRIQEKLGTMASVRALFTAPTVADLARSLLDKAPSIAASLDHLFVEDENTQGEDHALEAPVVNPQEDGEGESAQTVAVGPQPIPRDGELPLSFAQQRLWFLEQLMPGTALYSVPAAVRITGQLDILALERSLNAIVERHELLRTTFETVDGKAVQHIAPEMPVKLQVSDLRKLPVGSPSQAQQEREAEAHRLAMQEAKRPFDLARGPLLRAQLLQLDDNDYIALVTTHHIVSDEWSASVFLQELATLYEAFSSGQRPELPELPIQYVDFAHWQRERLQGDVLDSQLTYWRRQLAGVPPILELPTDRPRPAIQTFNGSRLYLSLPDDLSREIRSLARSEGVTLFTALLTAFTALLHRYSGETDICVGTPVANRNSTELERLIGFFVNTLVLRADLSGNPTFRELLYRVRDVAVEAYEHAEVPFEMLVDEIQPMRDMSHSPLFQVMFTVQEAIMNAVRLPDVTLTPSQSDSGTAKFDLTLSVVIEETGLCAVFEYNTDLFDRDTIDRMAGHFQTLLEGFVTDADRPLGSLPLLTAPEHRQLVVDWNDTATDLLKPWYVHQRVQEQAEQTPNAVAVVFQDTALTYQELDGRVNRLANYLQRLGVGPDTLVGVAVERSVELIVGLLAVLKAGGAYVPLDPTYPLERLAFMIEDSGIKVLLTQTHLLSRLPMERIADEAVSPPVCILLDADWPAIRQESDLSPESGVSPQSLAYVIYTSGSTGLPKGVMISHHGLINYLTWCEQAYPLDGGNGSPVHSSISFDLTITSILAPLVVGRPVHMLAEDVSVESLVTALCQRPDYSLVKITPAHLELLRQRLSPGEAAGCTRAFVIGGENLLAEQLYFWQQHAPNTLLINEYGPTETVVGCCVYMRSAGDRQPGSVPIGQPIINTRLYVLDRYLQPVPVGVPGELFIGGVGVARGYLNRPDLTAERFLPDPFSQETGSRMYRTGDLVRHLPGRDLEFLGRVDHQVKIHGFRIELGEIETTLSGHPGVRQAVVVVRDDESETKRLVSYVVPSGVPTPTIGELRRFLQVSLPDYMVPSTFVFLDALPLTPNRKVDRSALPVPGQTRPDLGSAYVAPDNQAEQVLAAIWAQVLGVDRVGVHDNFFELGGDSILSIQVIARANQAGLQLTPRQLFQAPTVHELAALVGSAVPVQAEQGPVTGPVPLTPIQHWFFEQNLPDPNHWNQSLLLEVVQPLDTQHLRDAVAALLEHHDALRLRFSHTMETNGSWIWQQSNAEVDHHIPFTLIDLSNLSREEQSRAIDSMATRIQSGLDLAKGPLMNVAYFLFGPDQPDRLLFVIHHLAVDGLSWRVLLEDLVTAYRQLSQGQPIRLPPKTTSFKRWAEQLAEYAQTESAQSELSYWLTLSESGGTPLPLDFPEGTNTEGSACNYAALLGAEETETLLREVPATYGADLNAILLTALAHTLKRWTGSDSVLVDVEGHGREDLFEEIDVSRTVGWFTALYPVQLDLSEQALCRAVPGTPIAENRVVGDTPTAPVFSRQALDSGASELPISGKLGQPERMLFAVNSQVEGVLRRGIFHGLLRYLSHDQETVSRLQALPTSQLSFNYLGQFDTGLGMRLGLIPAWESIGAELNPDARRQYLIEVSAGIVGGRLRLVWRYSENLHRNSTIRQLASGYITYLRTLITNCLALKDDGHVPADVSDVHLNPEDLEAVLAEIGQ